MRYVNLDAAPLWESLVVAVISAGLLIWRCWTLFPPSKRTRSALGMAAGAAAYTGSVLARRDSFGHGVELLALVAVSFSIASIGKLEAYRLELQQARAASATSSRGRSAEADAQNAARSVAPTIVLRLTAVAIVIAVAYWLLVTNLH